MSSLPRKSITTLFAAAVVISLFPLSASAMPNFARRYDLPCSTCHNPIPRLTEFGFQFRAAGFRMPDAIGKEEVKPPNVSDVDSARLQVRYDYNKVDNAGAKSTKDQLSFFEVTLYPASGSFYKNYSSLFELSLAPEEKMEIENAYVRGNWSSGGGHVSVRGGVFHPFEGYGASDRPLLIDRPFIQRTAAKFGSTKYFFTPWGFDEVGVEGGYTVNRTAIRATVFNGLDYSEEEAGAIPGQSGKTAGRPAYNSKDYQLFFNQILADNGGGVSLYYYKGALALPVGTGFMKNSYDRAAVYASYPVSKALFLGGYQQGSDNTFGANNTYGPDTKSKGYFLEGDYIPASTLGFAARWDSFDPSDRVSNNNVNALTLGVNKPLENGLQWLAQYQHRKTEQVAKSDRTDNTFQIRFIWIF
jgi:hypothetical protein